MKSYYRTKRMLGGVPCGCFTQRFIQDLENMDITSRYSKNVEPSGEGKDKSSPHILIELSTDQFNTLKSITKEVNEKYIEMGGITAIKYCDLANILDYILEVKLQDNSVLEEMVKHIEKDKEKNPEDYK